MNDTSNTGHAKIPAELSYEVARKHMADPDIEVRKALAHHAQTPGEILFYLAQDEEVEVRRAVAYNECTPRKADLVLTKDNDPEVRHQLANKIGRVLPNESLKTKEAIFEVTSQVLEELAKDEVAYVRAMLSEMVKSLPNVPANVIQTLAYDKSLTVAEPVLQFSPVLNDQDLLDIINSSPVQGAIAIISKREKVSAKVSNAIVESGDDEAILNLLENQKSKINEPVMGTILKQAPPKEKWHGPLVHRPKLSKKTIIRLTDFVAMQLLDDLQKRTDFDDDLLIELSQAIEKRIAKDAEEKKDMPGSDWEENDVDPEIQTLQDQGDLGQDFVEQALKKGKRQKVISAISVMAGISKDIVSRTLTQPRPKRICALCYKAGLSAHTARQIQVQMAKLPTTLVVSPTEDGDYPLHKEELLTILEQLD